MINVYAKVDGKLAHWEVSYHDHQEAIKIVKATLPAEYVGTVLARIK